jgi:hypothetical protein
VPLANGWKLHNLTLALIGSVPGDIRPGFPGNPDPIPNEDRVFGLSDWINGTLILPPLRSEKVTVAFGPAFGLPLATNARLGSQKWTTGPGFQIGYRPGKWNLNAIMINLWSFAGNASRAPVNQLIIRALFRRPLQKHWFFTSNPIITSNWRGNPGQRWLVPLGGGIGKAFSIGNRSMSIAVHGYYNIVKPNGAPNGLFRLDFLYPVPGSVHPD